MTLILWSLSWDLDLEIFGLEFCSSGFRVWDSVRDL